MCVISLKRVGAYTRPNNASPSNLDCRLFASAFPRVAAFFLLWTLVVMKVKIKKWHAIAQWRWDTGNNDPEDDGEGDVCGICRVPFEGCCPTCKMPGDDCPLSESPILHASSLSLSFPYRFTEQPLELVWGECTHVFHMHCLLQWIGTSSSKQQCPMDRRPWGECSLPQITYHI